MSIYSNLARSPAVRGTTRKEIRNRPCLASRVRNRNCILDRRASGKMRGNVETVSIWGGGGGDLCIRLMQLIPGSRRPSIAMLVAAVHSPDRPSIIPDVSIIGSRELRTEWLRRNSFGLYRGTNIFSRTRYNSSKRFAGSLPTNQCSRLFFI